MPVILRRYLNNVSEVVNLVACLETVVVNCSLFLVQVLFSPHQLGLETSQFLLSCFQLSDGRRLTELQLYNVPV